METAKQQMINAFWKLAEKKPVYMIKVKHVTDLANYNRCTFYQYFDDIYDLLDQAENILLEDIKKTIENAYDSETSYQESLHIAAESFQKYGKYLSILFGKNGSPSFQAKYKNTLRPIIASLLQDSDSGYSEIMYEYVIGGFISTVCYWYEHQETMSTQQLAALLYHLMTKGFLTKQPEK